jgi:two-component system LytT family response regulator
MIRALIADDEPLARNVVRGLLAAYADVDIVGESRNGVETLGAIRHLGPDLVFLDVQMPELDGFGVLRSLAGEVVPAVVFVTAYDDFAVRAFEEAALDYLVKPFTDERFHRTMARARRHLAGADGGELARSLAALVARIDSRAGPPAREYVQRMLVSSGNRSVSLRVGDVAWIEADDYYARLHTAGGSFLVRQSLSALEGQLDPAHFVRVHRGAIVNIEGVRELTRGDRGQLDVLLADGSRITVSERRRDSVLARLGATTVK